jgi:thioredoxin reductase
LVIIGAGPIGLDAALTARSLGWNVTVFEKGKLAEHVEHWGFVRMFTPFGQNVSAMGRSALEKLRVPVPADGDCLTGREFAEVYLKPLASSPLLADVIRTHQTVVGVARLGLLRTDGTADRRRTNPFRVLTRDASGSESSTIADVVIDCSGVYGHGRWLGDGGLPAAGEMAARAQIASGMEDVLGAQRAKYAGKTALVVGAGYTAATHVALLAELAETAPETWVVWLARGPRSQPLVRIANDPLRERDRIAARANALATRGDGNVEFHPSSTLERLVALGQDKGFQVTARVAGKLRVWDIDRIIASVGYRPDSTLYRELQVGQCPLTEAPLGCVPPLPSSGGLVNGNDADWGGEPNFFVIGAKSAGRGSQFFLKAGYEQVRQVFARLSAQGRFGGVE